MTTTVVVWNDLELPGEEGDQLCTDYAAFLERRNDVILLTWQIKLLKLLPTSFLELGEGRIYFLLKVPQIPMKDTMEELRRYIWQMECIQNLCRGYFQCL